MYIGIEPAINFMVKHCEQNQLQRPCGGVMLL